MRDNELRILLKWVSDRVFASNLSFYLFWAGLVLCIAFYVSSMIVMSGAECEAQQYCDSIKWNWGDKMLDNFARLSIVIGLGGAVLNNLVLNIRDVPVTVKQKKEAKRQEREQIKVAAERHQKQLEANVLD